jgi:hypothetical protein
LFASWLDFLLLGRHSRIAAEAWGDVSAVVEWVAKARLDLVRADGIAAGGLQGAGQPSAPTL